MRRFSDDELAGIRDRISPAEVAGDTVKLRRLRGSRKGFTHVGPCPICSRRSDAKDDGRFVAGADSWACAACPDGGDVFRLVMKRDGCDFLAAVETLGGVREEIVTPAIARRRGAAAFDRGVALDAAPAEVTAEIAAAWCDGWRAAERKALDAARYRERERKRLYDHFWQRAAAWPGTPVEAYLTRRGLMVPPGARLRFLDDVPFFADGSEFDPVILHRGPCMLAAITGVDGKFAGLHFTWIDLDQRKGKAVILDPDGCVLPAKKSRGHKQGGFIDLGDVSRGVPHHRMIAGEGIETVLSVYTAMMRAGRDLSGTAWRCGIDLGNLAGKALETVPHPTLKDKAGRPRNVPGPDPDPSSEAMPVPASIEELILLGDGDSDPFTTRNALARAAKRHSARQMALPSHAEGVTDPPPPPPPPRTVRVVFAEDGADFNDMLLKGRA